MRLLLDTCVCSGVAAELQAARHDVEWSGNWPRDPGDEEILAYALREARIIVNPGGSFLDARFPATTTFGNSITGPTADAIFRAFSQALPKNSSRYLA